MRRLSDHEDWPRFRWDPARLTTPLADLRHRQGRFVGHMESLAFPLRQEAILATLTEDLVRGAEIEGEVIDEPRARAAVARRLGLEREPSAPAVARTELRSEPRPLGVLIDATRRYDEPLSAERLREWHRMLAPGGGGSRSEPPPRLQTFSRWFEADIGPDQAVDPVLKAAVAHIWLVTINPFDAGNGWIARAATDLALARSERSPRRFYSVSAQMRRDQAAYRAILDRTQQGDLDVTPWLEWFLGCLGRAIDRAQVMHAGLMARARFWRAHPDLPLNERQRQMIDRLLAGDALALTTSSWARLAECSHDTALRDVLPLVAQGILVRSAAGGRSTTYRLRRSLGAEAYAGPDRQMVR